MKRTKSIARANLLVLKLVSCIWLIFSYSCGGSESEDVGGYSGTGSVAFTLELQDAGVARTRGVHQLAQAGFDCAGNGIATIEIQVLGKNEELLVSEEFDCEAHEGTVEGVEAGDDRTVVAVARGPAEGLLGAFAQAPDEDSSGKALFRGEVTGITIVGNETSDAGTIALWPVLPMPQANEDSEVTIEDTSATIPVIDNDLKTYYNENDGSFTNLDPSTLTIASNPTNGTALARSDGSITYEPNTNYYGTDLLRYSVQDELGNMSNEAEVTLTITPVDDPPEAMDDEITVMEDGRPTIINVLENDEDVDGGPRSVASVSGLGERNIFNNGTDVSYTPDQDFCTPPGTPPHQFTYTLTPGGGTATVYVTVTCVDDPVIAVDDPSGFATDEDTSLMTGNVLSNDSAADGGLSVLPGDVRSTNGAAVTLAVDGTFTYDPTGAPMLQALAAGATEDDQFSYTARDADGDYDTATVTVRVTGVNDLPLAQADAGAGFGTDEDSTFTTPNVLSNDSDPDVSDTLSVSRVDEISQQGAAITDLGDGTFSYDPTTSATLRALCEGQTSSDTFSYTVTDGRTFGTATVTLSITGANDAPTGQADAGAGFGTDEDSSFTTPNVLINDNDPDLCDTLSVSGVDEISQQGAAITDLGDGTFSYDPTTSATLNALAEGEISSDTFSYTVTDGRIFGTATVTLSITGVDDPPVGVDDLTTVTEDDPATTINVLGNDTDIDGGPISIASVSDPAGGNVVNNGTDLTYEPDPDFCTPGDTTDELTYTLTPGDRMARVYVRVTCVNDPPVLDPIGPQQVVEGQTLTINVTASDPEKDALSINASGPGDVGGVSFGDNGDGTATFTWLTGFTHAGNYTVTFTVTDDGVPALSDAETVAIAVQDLPPTPPTGLTAIPGVNEVSLSWSGVQSATSYNVYWADSPGGNKALIANTTSLSLIDNDLNRLSRRNFYVVTGQDNLSESGDSDEVFAFPWLVSTVDDTGTTGYGTSIDVSQSDDSVHIVYIDSPTSDIFDDVLKYATNVSGDWQRDIVRECGALEAACDDPSMALDSSDNVHIAISNVSTTVIQYLMGSAGQGFSPPDFVDTGSLPSIALDLADNVHISYHLLIQDYDIDYILHATYGEGWYSETVAFNNLGSANSIALDSSDNVYISFYLETLLGPVTLRVPYLADNINIDGPWNLETLDGFAGGRFNSTAINQIDDSVHVTYYGDGPTTGDPGTLIYAMRDASGWQSEIVDSDGDVGGYTSIALDSEGSVHVSYYDFTNANLKYATNASGVWVTEGVDEPGDVGRYTSIALDSEDNVHISYFDTDNGDLKYATKAIRTLDF